MLLPVFVVPDQKPSAVAVDCGLFGVADVLVELLEPPQADKENAKP